MGSCKNLRSKNADLAFAPYKGALMLCLCQFTEECVTRFVHALDREDVTALAELFTRHLFGYVSGSAVHRVNTEIFHRLH